MNVSADFLMNCGLNWKGKGWSLADIDAGQARVTTYMKDGCGSKYAFIRTCIERDFSWAALEEILWGVPKRPEWVGKGPDPRGSMIARIEYLNGFGVSDYWQEFLIEVFDAWVTNDTIR